MVQAGGEVSGNGSGSEPQLTVSEIEFSDGKSVKLDENEIVIFVGANNVGKTFTLGEIARHVENQKHHTGSVRRLEVEKKGSLEELRAFLTRTCTIEGGHYRHIQYSVHSKDFTFWERENIGNDLVKFFIKNISLESRIEASKRGQSLDGTGRPVLPQQVLYADETGETAQEISDLFEEVFGAALTMDLRAGARLPIHVGEAPMTVDGEDRLSKTYLDRLRKLPLLDQQGHGMRAAFGLFMEAIVYQHWITLIDEPEAFLHPPQARKIARVLARKSKKQLFVSTHSSDVLRGFLEIESGSSPEKQVSVIRLTRSAQGFATHRVEPDVIRSLWENPEMKYSNVLDAIFHDECVLCEAEWDCRFYNALADHQSTNGSADRLFVPTGGKAAMPNFAEPLRLLGVPTKVIVDIDIFSNKEQFKKMVEAMGGNWSDYEVDWRVMDSDVRKGVKPLTPEEIKQSIIEIINEAETDDLPSGDIRSALKDSSPWSNVKKGGKTFIPPGNATDAFERLDLALQGIGIFVVPVGELEGFCRSIGGKGAKFVRKVLNTVELNDLKLRDAGEFVQKVCP